MAAKVVVLGSNFGGMVASLAVKHELGDDVDVTVVSPAERFIFTPSLIWVPFGKRSLEQISFKVARTLDEHGIHFINESAAKIDPEAKQVTTKGGQVVGYDYLVVATGYRNDYDKVPGIGEGANASTITTVPEAFAASTHWARFLQHPGDIVIGATPSAGCFGAAYEFMFNTAYQLKKHKLHKQVKITYVTSEPFLGHFGIGGLPHGEQLLGTFLRKLKIDAIQNVAMREVDEKVLRLEDGRNLDFEWAMIIPPFIGQKVVAETPGLADEKGFIPVRGTYQSEKYDDVYAVGVAAAVSVPWTTPVPVGIPKTGFPTEQQAHVAAKNIAAQIRGEQPHDEKLFGDIPAVCVMDAGNNGVIILADKMLPPRKHGVLVPGPQAHAMKLAFEKYFLWKTKNGHVNLP